MRRLLALWVLAAGCQSSALSPGGDAGADLAMPTPPSDLALPAPPDLSTVPDLARPSPPPSPPPLLLFGEPCARDSQCASGVCLPSGICSRPCSGAADCPNAPEWYCAADGSAPVCRCTPGLGGEVCGAGHDVDCDGRIDNMPLVMVRQFVADVLTVPMQRSDFALDLNGDGKLDNQYGNIIGALTAQNLNVQQQADTAVASGSDLLLIAGSAAASFTTDSCAGATVVLGQSQPNPDFSGAGHFSADSYPPGKFQGAIAASQFSSAPLPSVALVPVEVTVKLPFIGGLLALPLVGAHVQLTYDQAGHLTGGQLNGAVRQAVLQSQVYPAMAQQFTSVVQAMPCTATCMQVELIFDTGGCTNPDGTMARKGDHVIDVCEVSSNSIIRNVLAPDVQLFDAAGNYHPNPANTVKDSLSVGFGFHAVSATF
jgi:hypothetical protein